MHYVEKYKLWFHTFNKEVEDTVKVDNGLSFFDSEKNCTVYNERDAVHYVKSMHKQGNVEKIATIPEEIYSSEYGEVGATTLKVLRTWIG